MARVRAVREALGLSQEVFAERAGLTYKHYQQVETGKKAKITLPTIEKLAKACGLELDELFDFKTDPVPVAEERASAKGGYKASKGRSGPVKG